MSYTGAWLASVRERQAVTEERTPDTVAPLPTDQPLPVNQQSADPGMPPALTEPFYLLPALDSSSPPGREHRVPGFGYTTEEAMAVRDAQQAAANDIPHLREGPSSAPYVGGTDVHDTGVPPRVPESHQFTANGDEFPHTVLHVGSDAPLRNGRLDSHPDPLWDAGIVERPMPTGGVSAGVKGGIDDFSLFHVVTPGPHEYVQVANDAPREPAPIAPAAGEPVTGLWSL